MDSLICPANCGKSFKSQKGLASHLPQASSCAWYRSYEKSVPPEIPIDQEDLPGNELMCRENEGDPGMVGEEVAELLQELEEENDPFHFVPLDTEPDFGVAGPGPSTQAHRDTLAERQLGGKIRTLDDGDMSLFEEEHKTGGAVVRMDQSLHDRWRLAHNITVDVPMDGTSNAPGNIYAPFASEMDWRVAEWVVKDNIGHSSFDHFLQIPGVSNWCSQLFCCSNHFFRSRGNLDYHITM